MNPSLSIETAKHLTGQPHAHMYCDGRCAVCDELDPSFASSFSEWLDQHNDYLAESPDTHTAPHNNPVVD